MTSNMDDISQVTDKQNIAVRDEIITTAVKFLQHPNVQKSSVEQREAFLRKKGLTEQEITVAFERSLVQPPVQQFSQQQFQPLPPPHAAIPMPGYMLPPPLTGWGRLRELFHNIAIVGSVLYGLYALYRRYIAPFLFGAPKKPPAIQDSIKLLDSSVKTSVQELRTELQKVQTDVQKISEQQELSRNNATSKQMQELKFEIISLKGLLLNRKQFTSPNIEPPSIPAWQMEAERDAELKGDEETGSLGSEAEVVTNNGSNGSDSSLEMIKE